MTFSLETLEKALDGDKKATSVVIKQYTPLVHKIVNKYKFMAAAPLREDLVQEGFIGLYNALKTYEPPVKLTLESWSTWAYWKVRGAVVVAARKEFRHVQSDRMPFAQIQSQDKPVKDITSVCYESDYHRSESLNFEMEPSIPSIKEIIISGCGSLESKRAKIVCSKFGLMGQKPMRSKDLAEKFGISKQSVAGYIQRFSQAVKQRHPELAEFVAGG